MKLNLGCGGDVKKGWLNCDLVDGPGVDKVFDASQVPLPFDDNSVDEILVSHVLEHIPTWESTVTDMARILKPGGLLTVRVPYGVNFTTYHVRYFGPETLDIFIENGRSVPSVAFDNCHQVPFQNPPFRLIKREIRYGFWFGWHLNHYLHISYFQGRTWEWPIFKRVELVWVLTKVLERSERKIRVRRLIQTTNKNR